MLFKTCCRCKVEKPVEAFSRNRAARDRLQSACRDCHKAYHQKNADALNERKRDYRQKNADALNERKRDYRQKNADAIKERQRVYRQKNAGALNERKRDYRQSLRTGYVRKVTAKMLNVPTSEVTPEQIEIHRASMALKRSARAITSELKKGKP